MNANLKAFLVTVAAVTVLFLAAAFSQDANARGHHSPSTSEISDTWDRIYNEALRECVGPRHVEGTKGVRYWDCVTIATEKATAVVRARY